MAGAGHYEGLTRPCLVPLGSAGLEFYRLGFGALASALLCLPALKKSKLYYPRERREAVQHEETDGLLPEKGEGAVFWGELS